MIRRALALAALGLACLPSAALAHAQLEGTTPARGATVKSAPPLVAFRFDEPVEGNFGAVRVYDSSGARVDQGDAFHPGGSGPRLGVHLKPGSKDGTYTATYRVVSADGHIVSGGFSFNIGHAAAGAGISVAQLIAGEKTGKPTQIVFGAARAVQYGSIATAVGGLIFLLSIWLPSLALLADGSDGWADASAAFARRLRRVLLAASLAGAASAAAGVVLEAASAAGISGWSALRPHIVNEVLGTRFGLTWAIAAGVWLCVGAAAALLLAPRARRAPVLRTASVGATGLALPGGSEKGLLAVLGLPLAYLVILPSISGHGSTQHPKGVLFPADVVHVLSMSAWIGGLVALLAVLPAATRALPGEDRGRALAATVERFSPLALGAVLAILVTGLLQSYEEIRHFDLIFHTPFGRAAFIKLCLLIVLIGLGALNRQRTLPRLRRIVDGGGTPGEAGVVLRRTLRAELALVLCVLGTTGALASYAPAIAQVSGPASGTVAIGPEQLQYTVDPAQVGTNEVHLYLENPKTGAQYAGAKEVTVTATQPKKQIGPVPLKALLSGPGHYTITDATLAVPGTWQMAVTMRVSEFDQYTATVKVPIR